MGLSSAAIRLYLELWQRGLFKNVKTVLDMGSQELHLKPADFEALINAAGISEYDPADFPNLQYWPGAPRQSARPFYKLLGIPEYASVDLGGMHGALVIDLNKPLDRTELHNRYDMVTDHGNNEHPFNVAEAYRTMHRLCKPGGLLVIEQSLFQGNGYYLFDTSFFEGLAAANNYRILFSTYAVTTKEYTTAGSNIQFNLPLSRELLNTLDWTKVSSIGTSYVLQKQSADDFRYPYQGDYLSQQQGHMGYMLSFLPEPPSRSYVPIYSEKDLGLPTRTLVSLTTKRVVRSVKSRLGVK